MSKRLTPMQKLMKAIYGTTTPSEEQIEKARERLIERQAASVTDEDFKRMTGRSIEETTSRLMIHAGWCDAVARWRQEHEDDRRYHVTEHERVFTFQQAIDMARTFYLQGREDAASGTDEYDRLCKINREGRGEETEDSGSIKKT